MFVRWAYLWGAVFAAAVHAEPGLSVQALRQAPEGIRLNDRPVDFSRMAVSFGPVSAAPVALRVGLRIHNQHPKNALTFELAWDVKALSGKQLLAVGPEKHEIQAQASIELHCTAPSPQVAGPLLFHFEVTEGDKKLAGVIPAGQANSVLLLDDFERVTRPFSGNVRLEPGAAHTGQFGLRAEASKTDRERLAAVAAFCQAAEAGDLAGCHKAASALGDLRWFGNVLRGIHDGRLQEQQKIARARKEAETLQARFLQHQSTAVPLERQLPGRPVSVHVWVRPAKRGGRLELDLDAVVDQHGRARHRWAIPGPELDWEGWREVTFELPIYDGLHQPAAQHELQKNPDAKGPANYPFRLESIAVCGMGAVSLDDLTVRTQQDTPASIQVLAGGRLPGGLVMPGEPIRVLLQNTSPEQPLDGTVSFRLADLMGEVHSEGRVSFSLPPAGQQSHELGTEQLPIGVYGLRLRAMAADQALYQNETDEITGRERPGERIVIYRPDLPALDLPKLYDFLRDGHAVEMELGKRHELIKMQWENSYPERRDGIQPREGLWQWHDYDAAVREAVAARKSPIGRLGLTAAWASPAGRYDDFHNHDWVGSPFVLPERSIYWERYVYQVVKRYREEVGVWELWDEPDDPAFSTTAKEFTERIVKVAAKAAREAAPDCKLLLGGVTRERLLPFLRDFIDAGGHQLVDAIGLHPTMDPLSPERGFLEELLREACRVAGKAGVADKLWVTELGWNVGGAGHVSELEQAQYVARGFTLARFAGIRRVLVDLHPPQWNETSTGLLFRTRAQPDFVQFRLGAFAFKQFQRVLPENAEPIAELALRDRAFRLSRAYLFRRPEDYVLAVWRVTGRARMPRISDRIQDLVGNEVSKSLTGIQLTPTPLYIFLPTEDVTRLRRRVERLPLEFEDAPESEWKKKLYYFADVGDPDEETNAGYELSGKSLIVTKSSVYPSKWEVRDSGRIVHGSESYAVPLKDLGPNDLLLRRRIDYSAAGPDAKGQTCQVSVDGQTVGIWSIPGRDQQRQWRDSTFLVPNRFLSGKAVAKVRLSAVDGPFTTFDFAAGPKKPGTLYLSDIDPLVDSQGWVGLSRRDTSFLGSALTIREQRYDKGLGVHAPSVIVFSLNGQFRKFVFHPGIDDVTEGKGSVRFKVLVDGRPAYDSRRVDAFAVLPPQEVDVSGVEVLRLVVEDGADGKENDIADWADAKLVY